MSGSIVTKLADVPSAGSRNSSQSPTRLDLPETILPIEMLGRRIDCNDRMEGSTGGMEAPRRTGTAANAGVSNLVANHHV